MLQKFNPQKTRQLKQVNAMLNIVFHEKKAKESLDFQTANNILIIDPTAIGDMVMLIPLLRIIRKNAPHARITLVCASWGKAILENQDLVDEFVLVNNKTLNSPKEMILKWGQIRSTIDEINRKQYDIALEPRGDLRYIFFMHFCRARRKVSYNYTGGECFLTDVVKPGEQVKHLVEDKLYFLDQIGCKFTEEDGYPRLFLTEEQCKQNERFLKENELEGKRIVGLHPGASLKFKRWEGFGEVLRKIHNEFENTVFLIFEGPDEEDAVKRVSETAKECGARFIVSRTAISEYMQRLALCDAVICNDSGAGHIAAAYGVYVFVISGPFLPEYVAPYARDKVFVFSYDQLSCKPCMSTTCKRNFECLRNVLPDTVFEAVKRNWREITRTCNTIEAMQG